MIVEVTAGMAIMWWIGICSVACAGALFVLWLAKKMVVDEETDNLQKKWKETRLLENIDKLDLKINGISRLMSPATSIMKMKEDLKKIEAGTDDHRLLEMEKHVQDMENRLKIIENALEMLEERRNGASSVDKAEMD